MIIVIQLNRLKKSKYFLTEKQLILKNPVILKIPPSRNNNC
jgi:hypothetical protein